MDEAKFRVEFRYGGGHWSYKYFTTLEDAQSATDSKLVQVVPWSLKFTTRYPRSQQIQVQGPRGGWKPLRAERVSG